MFKGFKKVGSDDKSTFFKHPNGSHLKVAHKGLSKDKLEKLKSLPTHKEASPVIHAAYGADVDAGGGDESVQLPDWATKPGYQLLQDAASPQPEISRDQTQAFLADPNSPYAKDYPDKLQAAASYYGLNQSPAPQAQSAPQSEVPTQDAPAAPMPAQPQQVAEAPPPSDPTGGQPEENDAIDQGPSRTIQSQDAQAAGEDQQAAQSYQQGFHDYYQNHANEFGAEDAAWQHDLVNGHVTPESYSDLFAKKSTLGKIGLLFGMLVSGAGSGLAHQPNAMMEMMNNEIKNDLEAQGKSKDNAQNFLKIHMQQALNQAQIQRYASENKLTAAQAKSAMAEANMKSYAFSQMKMNRVVVHNLASKIENMPEGPQKELARQKLAMLSGVVDMTNANVADVASANLAKFDLLKNYMGQSGGGPNPTALRLLGQKDLAESVEQKLVPGQGMAQVPLTSDDRNSITSGVNFQNELQRFMDWTKNHSGSLNPADRAAGQAMAAQLQNAYRNAIHGGVYKEGEQGFIGKVIDPNPTKFFNNIRVLPKLQAVQNESREQLNTLLRSKGMKEFQAAGAPSEGMVMKSKSGRDIIFKGGKWMYK